MTEEIRPIRLEELDDYVNMGVQAFRGTPAKGRRSRERNEHRLGDTRALFVDGRMMVRLKMIDMPLWFGSAPVPNGGITGVASPPEHRRRGYIGRLLHAVLAELRAQGTPLAALYPFYFPFYKRYGWEHVADNIHYRIPLRQLPATGPTGTWHPAQRGTDLHADQDGGQMASADLAVLRGIYDTWAIGRHGPMVRDEDWWRHAKLREGEEKRPDVYYWRNAAGAPRAYVLYSFETLENEWTRRMHVWEMTALDAEALRAVLAFLRNHDSQARETRVRVPPDLPLPALLDDPEFPGEIEAGLMLRLVDVPAALAARRYPAGVTADLTIAVTDSFLDWNNGVWRLAVAGTTGQATPADGSAGLRMDQRTLARLYAGYVTPAEAAALGLLEVRDPAALVAADNIFAGPRPFIADFF